jgi:hypothetical protein
MLNIILLVVVALFESEKAIYHLHFERLPANLIRKQSSQIEMLVGTHVFV